MLDENLPSFLLAECSDGVKHHAAFYLTREGGDPQPAYSLHHADPASPSSSNCYAAALFDAYNPEVLYGETLIRPNWTRPTLSAEDQRRNGGVSLPPEPSMPTSFTIQLYNPDLQIEVTREQGLFGSSHYDFAMPQDTFRTPSGSMLDRTQDDPAASIATPKIQFRWKKESKLGKDMTLFVKGKTTDAIQKKRNREPDIAVALFRSLKEVTLYESNLHRIEMEDVKGLEVVLLLTATVIRDVFYGQIRQVFNISEPDGIRRSSSAAAREQQARIAQQGQRLSPPSAVVGGPYPNSQRPQQKSSPDSNQKLQQQQQQRPHNPASPITDPRTQWEIDAETARLKAQAKNDAREQKRLQEARRLERERQDEEEARRLRKMVETEQKEQRRRQKEVDKETERLKRIYMVQPAPAPQIQSAPLQQHYQQSPRPQYQQNWPQYNTRPTAPSPAPGPQTHVQPHSQHRPTRPQQQSPAPYLPAGLNALNLGASMSNLLVPGAQGGGGKMQKKKKKSMWDLGGSSRPRSLSDSGRPALSSQKSSVF